mgnify:CR=1 FL=1
MALPVWYPANPALNVQYHYDMTADGNKGIGRLTAVQDASGVLGYSYDERGNLVEAVDPLGNKTEYAYSPASLLVAVKDANGNEKTLGYNDSGQVVEYVDCSGKTSAWEYNELGQMICFTDAAGNVFDLKGKETFALCRCGVSANRPFCDGAHNGQFEHQATAFALPPKKA